jgi:hypothetical protein
MLIPVVAVALFSNHLDPVAPKAAPLVLRNPVVDKNFYFLSLIHRDPAVEREIERDPKLAQIADDRQRALKAAFDQTSDGAIDGLRLIPFSDAQIDTAGVALGQLYDRSIAMKAFVGSLRAGGAYQRYAGRDDRALLANAWRDCAMGMNSIVAVYGIQTAPARSPQIDSPLYKVDSSFFRAMVHTLLGLVLDQPSPSKLFFDGNLDVAAQLLDIQLRDEAGRHEPMENRVNRLAYEQVRRTNFAAYPYSVILVPGEGPEESNVALSPAGKLRIEFAVHRFRAKKAPFILVSGGYVHPSMTPYSEAIEMKKSLMRDFGIPERAIIVDPHARHTTTNLRNAARLIYRYGIPFDKPGLCVSDPFQSGYIDSKSLFDRCQSIFGYQPVGHYHRTSEFDVEFLPNIESLSMDAVDPLDP